MSVGTFGGGLTTPPNMLKLYIIMLIMLFSGTADTIILKLQDASPTFDEKGNPSTYKHPFFQAACMFLGQSTCLIVYYY